MLLLRIRNKQIQLKLKARFIDRSATGKLTLGALEKGLQRSSSQCINNSNLCKDTS